MLGNGQYLGLYTRLILGELPKFAFVPDMEKAFHLMRDETPSGFIDDHKGKSDDGRPGYRFAPMRFDEFV